MERRRIARVGSTRRDGPRRCRRRREAAAPDDRRPAADVPATLETGLSGGARRRVGAGPGQRRLRRVRVRARRRPAEPAGSAGRGRQPTGPGWPSPRSATSPSRSPACSSASRWPRSASARSASRPSPTCSRGRWRRSGSRERAVRGHQLRPGADDRGVPAHGARRAGPEVPGHRPGRADPAAGWPCRCAPSSFVVRAGRAGPRRPRPRRDAAAAHPATRTSSSAPTRPRSWRACCRGLPGRGACWRADEHALLSSAIAFAGEARGRGDGARARRSSPCRLGAPVAEVEAVLVRYAATPGCRSRAATSTTCSGSSTPRTCSSAAVEAAGRPLPMRLLRRLLPGRPSTARSTRSW